MKVELVGTGAIYTKYNSACALINDDFMIDMPNGGFKQLLKTNHKVEKIKTIAITHFHGDHTADIPFFLKYIVKYVESTDIVTFVGPKGLKDCIVKLFETYQYEIRSEIEEDYKSIRFIEIDEGSIIKVNGYTIQSISVLHGKKKPAYGYMINNILGYTGDTGICDGVEKIMEKSQKVIADASKIEGDSGHMGIDNLQYLVNKYHKPIVATHLKDKTREELIRQNITNIIVPEDGDKFEI